MPTIVVPEAPDTADAAALIAELDAYLIPLYPIEDHYGYSIEKLLEEEVAFFVIRHDGLAAGCGGVKLFGTAYGEIKRMYVRPPFRGLGLGRRMLENLTTYALHHAVDELRLET